MHGASAAARLSNVRQDVGSGLVVVAFAVSFPTYADFTGKLVAIAYCVDANAEQVRRAMDYLFVIMPGKNSAISGNTTSKKHSRVAQST